MKIKLDQAKSTRETELLETIQYFCDIISTSVNHPNMEDLLFRLDQSQIICSIK